LANGNLTTLVQEEVDNITKTIPWTVQIPNSEVGLNYSLTADPVFNPDFV